MPDPTPMSAAQSQVRDEPGMGRVEIFPLATDEAALLALLEQVFGTYWRSIHFGPIIQGAAWEVKAPGAPRKISLLDGYATVDFGPWHFHICIGPTAGIGSAPTPPELAQHRRCRRAELYRTFNRNSGAPNSWGLRLFNGKDEQQLTVLLPNPFLSDEGKTLRPPQWERLAAWDELRRRWLGLDPDPVDRSGTGFTHG
jgi:hypothetical protein